MATFTAKPGGYLARVRKQGVVASRTFKRKADAKAWATGVEADIEAGSRGAIPDKTFADLLDRYIKEATVKKDGAKAEALRLGRVMRDAIGTVKLDQLDAVHVAAWRNRRMHEVSDESVRREWSSMSAACKLAINEWKWLRANPFDGVKKPPKAPPRKRRVSQDEIDRLVLACGYGQNVALTTAQSRVGAALLFAIETAMRAGEICALQWGDVDLDRKTVMVTATLRGARKTKTSREVPLSTAAQAIITQLRAVQEGDFVFGLDAAILDALFRKAKQRALVEGLHFHDTRREALTRLARLPGMDIMKLAKISGHRDLRILQEVYYAPDVSEFVGLLG